MTMDIHQRGLRTETIPSLPPAVRASPEKTSKSPSSSPITEITSSPQKPTKRSFDVAFLMAPDDLSTKKRQQQQLRLVTSAALMQRHSSPQSTLAQPSDSIELKISRSLNHQRLLPRGNINDFSPHHTSPLGLLIPSPKDFQKISPITKDPIIDITQEEQSLQFTKSAFTKVKSGREFNGSQNIPASPSSISSTMSGGVSPDISYQESLSPSLMNNNSNSPVNYLHPSKTLPPNIAFFATGSKGLPPMNSRQYFDSHQAKEKLEGNSSSPIDTNGFLGQFMNKTPTDPMQKLRPMLYHGAGGLPYGGVPVAAYPFPPNFPPTGGPVATHLLTAAASVTAALLPPALAALTLPAQNVCAKCKISFRMTSDLVYHMRSHHKGEHVAIDSARRRREQDKLRCPVCNETFRERHHLTRHMTAHQDKEGDHDDEDDALEIGRRRSHQNLLGAQHK